MLFSSPALPGAPAALLALGQFIASLVLTRARLVFQMAAAGRADVENYDWRASTRQVSEDGYNTALRLWQQSRKATSDWWPWWTKKAEWQA